MSEFGGNLDRCLATSVEHHYEGRFEEVLCGCGAVLDWREMEAGVCRKCQEEDYEE